MSLTKELKDQIASLRVEESGVEKQLEEADREVAGYSISHLFEELSKKYSELPQVVGYLKDVVGPIEWNGSINGDGSVAGVSVPGASGSMRSCMAGGMRGIMACGRSTSIWATISVFRLADVSQLM